MTAKQITHASLSTSDLFDNEPDRFTQLDLPFRHFGGIRKFSGPCATIRAASDPSTIRDAVEEPGAGRVLLIDGRGVSDRACLGDMLAARAAASGWAGAVILGAIRDSAGMAGIEIGVVALRTTAMRPFGTQAGERDVVIEHNGLTISPGEMIFVDEDAVLVLQA